MKPPQELSINSFLKIAWFRRKECLFIISFVTLLSVIIFLSLPKKYMAVATIMNVSEENQSLSGGSFFQIVGLAKSFDQGYFKFTAIIKSRSFKEQVVNSLGADFFTPKEGWKGTKEELKNYGVSLLGQAIKARINPDQSNVLNIIVVTKDREKAPLIANQILVDLQKYISQNSLTKAKRLRDYIEDNIIETKAAIFETAKVMANFYKKYSVNPQKSKVENPLHNEVIKLTSQKLEDIVRDPLLNVNYGLLEEKKQKLLEKLKSIDEIPEQSYFDYLQEEYQILKEINVTLRQQYEMAKLEAIRQEPSFQIIDSAMGASYSGPNRRQFYFAGFIISLMLTFLYILYWIFFPPQGAVQRQ